jgi:hypothetical protein
MLYILVDSAKPAHTNSITTRSKKIMATKDPKLVAEKWVRRTQAASQDMVNGVNAVTVNPAQQAIAKESKLLQNITESITSGKWRRGMQAVTLDGWKQAMITKGSPRVAAGAQAAQTKAEQFYAELLPYQDQIKTKLQSMPDMTLQDNIQKAVTWMTDMSKFRRRGQ